MRRLIPLTLTLGLVGCAHSYEPMIDTRGVDPARYQADLTECRTYAEQVSPAEEAAGGAAAGAVLGAALGAIAGAFSGSPGTGAGMGAALGGTSGVASGAASGVAGQKEVIRNCLRGRGYSVLR
ncbi:MAG: glycine zipper family protein [Rhodospirillaceae bacterium]|nr:glycine zipper family protein [Rhodospirillaceae bacterium]